jgi:hypothetical protein
MPINKCKVTIRETMMCHRVQPRIKTKACTALLPTVGVEGSHTQRKVFMRKVTAWIVLVALFPIVLGGCATGTQTGAVLGATAGAVIGAGVGFFLGGQQGAFIGATIGTGLGTATGAAVGQHFENRQQHTRPQASQAHTYQPSQGQLLAVSEMRVVPMLVKPGDTVQVTVTYDVLAPEPNRQIPITETWVFKHNTTQLTTIARPEQLKDQGGYASTYTFTMAKNALPGEYQAIVTVSNRVLATTVATPFRVQN